LKASAGVVAAVAVTSIVGRLNFFEAIGEGIDNPLEFYPTRDWEKVYRDQYRYDSSFTYVCSPNDTHACRLRAFVRNGVVIRMEQNYDSQKIMDIGLDKGAQATRGWNPRGCLKGFTMTRRLYGPARLRYPMMRQGWKQWADDGFPSLSDDITLRTKYKFDSRGTDTFLRLSWDEVNDYLARALTTLAETYSGEVGKQRLLKDGYPEEMLTEWKEAGTRTFKFRGGMGLLGVIGLYGLYRFSNMMALLDSKVRKVGPDKAQGGRKWSNYTWHGDQAPGHPFVHGLQGSDIDLNDLRYTKLHIHVGKNLIENKMPESHWFVETMERGAKIVVIAPEYNPPATKADYWISVRPGLSDTSLFLGVTKILMDKGWYDAAFVKQFTDFPLIVRADTLKKLKAKDVFPNYVNQDITQGASVRIQNLTSEQREDVGDCVVWDEKTNGLKAITRDDVGEKLVARGIDPTLEWKGKIKLADGQEVEVLTLWEMYKVHLKDYDADTVHEITGAPKESVERLAKDIATIKPVAIHYGEGINHWFHATLHNRATYLPLMLTGNIGIPGSGAHTWAGNYKAGLFQGSPRTGPGFAGWVGEDPFQPNLDPTKPQTFDDVKSYARGEEVGYWAHGDRPLIVDTPKFGRKVFTGRTHLPTPTKVMWTTNVNVINNAKWAYELVKNINPKIDMIVAQEIEMTGSCEYSDILLPAVTWVEKQCYEMTASCSNPFLQIWGGGAGLEPVYKETKDDLLIMTGIAQKLSQLTGDNRFQDYWKFAIEGREHVYIDRLLATSIPTEGYTHKDIMDGKYGEPGVALLLFRTYPRQPFYEQITDSLPFYTTDGRLQSYCDVDKAIEYGENFIVHREGPEATPYLPNVIVSSNPYIRPEDYGIPRDAMDADQRTVRNIKLPWSEVKNTKNPLWEQGYRFYCLTPKTRHRVHSSWGTVDWHHIWDSSFGDPYRRDKRTPFVGEHQLHLNPQAAKDMGINEGDYVHVDANPVDRPYVGWKPEDPFYKVARCMLRVIYNPAYPYQVCMMKHAAFMATDRTVLAHETRADGLARAEGTNYQASLRYGSQQSLTRSWLMPMHQLDGLFHKSKAKMNFVYGYEADNHAINTVPKETLVKIAKAEDGGLGGQGIWAPATTGFIPSEESPFMQKYLRGETVEIRR
jgi:nitrate reductase alpha subunit